MAVARGHDDGKKRVVDHHSLTWLMEAKNYGTANTPERTNQECRLKAFHSIAPTTFQVIGISLFLLLGMAR